MQYASSGPGAEYAPPHGDRLPVTGLRTGGLFPVSSAVAMVVVPCLLQIKVLLDFLAAAKPRILISVLLLTEIPNPFHVGPVQFFSQQWKATFNGGLH